VRAPRRKILGKRAEAACEHVSWQEEDAEIIPTADTIYRRLADIPPK
jgi:hypothetical protein